MLLIDYRLTRRTYIIICIIIIIIIIIIILVNIFIMYSNKI